MLSEIIMNKYPKRKTTRLKEYDYTNPGYYFVTICAYDRKCLFGEIIDDNMELNDSGQMVDNILRTLPEYYPDIVINNHVVMPNHLHCIIMINNPANWDKNEHNIKNYNASADCKRRVQTQQISYGQLTKWSALPIQHPFEKPLLSIQFLS